MWIRLEVSTYPYELYYQGMVNKLPALCTNMSQCLLPLGRSAQTFSQLLLVIFMSEFGIRSTLEPKEHYHASDISCRTATAGVEPGCNYHLVDHTTPCYVC